MLKSLSLYFLNSIFIVVLIKYNYQIKCERIAWCDSMLRSINEESSFENNIKQAIDAIKSNKYDLARKYLFAAMIENDHSAIVYNLLGVISEYKGDEFLACQFYRAAYVFDPTYKPADRNLEKLTSFFYRFNEESIDYGDTIEAEDKKSYFCEYNGMHFGHLKKIKLGRKSAC